MRVYLASAYPTRERIAAYAEELTRIGFTVTARWLEEKHDINPGTTGAATALPDRQVQQHALDDLTDINRSDILVLFTESATGERGGGGRHVETGYALARNVPVIVVGEPETVFHRLPQVTRVADWHAALIVLARQFVDHRSQTDRVASG